MAFPEKRGVLEALIAAMEATLQHTTQAAEEVRRGAVHEEARPENDKDTRALEQTYLARGQAMRAEALLDHIQVLRSMPLGSAGADASIRAGSLVELEGEDGSARYFFLAPHGGGETVVVDGVRVVVVTPSSALGRALLGKRAGDVIEVRRREGAREYEISSVG